jgi:hypothetical protein
VHLGRRTRARHGLFLNDVEYFPDLHGGTLRWSSSTRQRSRTDRSMRRLPARSERGGLDRSATTGRSASGSIRCDGVLGTCCRSSGTEGRTIAAYGAAAKGTMLLNYVGIGRTLVDYVVDRNVHKQGRFMPGTHQPIRDPGVLLEERPDYVLLLAWNFADEIIGQQASYLAAGGRFILPVPDVRFVP